jgi:hypothetical protein
MIKKMKEQKEKFILEKNDNNSTFKRLQEIQVLIKKESGLKELCRYYINKLLYIIYIV